MKTITNRKVKFIAVPVPGDAKKIQLTRDKHGDYVSWRIGIGINIIDMPDTTVNHTILGKLSELTEDQCAELVEGQVVATRGDDYQDYYRDYLKPFEDSEWPWIAGDPVKSLNSLLQSNGLNLKSWITCKQSEHNAVQREYWQEYEQKLSEAAEDYLIILI